MPKPYRIEATDSEWSEKAYECKDQKNGEFFSTELDEETLRFIKDIARSSLDTPELIAKINEDYSVRRTNLEQPISCINIQELDFKKEYIECLLPHIDQIVTNYSVSDNAIPP